MMALSSCCVSKRSHAKQMTIYLLTYSRRELCIADVYIVQKDQAYNKNHWQVLFSCPGCDKVLSAEVEAKPLCCRIMSCKRVSQL